MSILGTCITIKFAILSFCHYMTGNHEISILVNHPLVNGILYKINKEIRVLKLSIQFSKENTIFVLRMRKD